MRMSGRVLPRPTIESVRAMDRLLRAKRGLIAHIARELKILPQAIHQWRQVPLDRVIEVEKATGIHRSLLRPDFFEPAPSIGRGMRTWVSANGRGKTVNAHFAIWRTGRKSKTIHISYNDTPDERFRATVPGGTPLAKRLNQIIDHHVRQR